MRILTANEGKVFAYKDEEGKEQVLGNVLYLGKEDRPERYYQIDKVEEEDARDKES